MSLDRSIALIILLFSLIYGYSAFFTMDAGLPPFMRFNPIWPSTFPKILSVLASICAFAILIGVEKQDNAQSDLDVKRLNKNTIAQAVSLLVIMIAYALLLRPLGFLIATVTFLSLSSITLGERKFIPLFIISSLAAGGIWALVQNVLGIYLSPLPSFIAFGG